MTTCGGKLDQISKNKKNKKTEQNKKTHTNKFMFSKNGRKINPAVVNSCI